MRPRHTSPRPWQPLSDAEYEALLPYLPASGGRGRPPADRRRTLDAIFWIACTRDPWRTLPPELGRADSVHRQLRRWTRAGILDHLLAVLAGPFGSDTLRGLEYWLCRAWRRMARLASIPSLLLVRRLGLWTALPCPPVLLPNPDLSEALHRLALHHLEAFLNRSVHPPPGLLGRLGRLIGFAGAVGVRFRLK